MCDPEKEKITQSELESDLEQAIAGGEMTAARILMQAVSVDSIVDKIQSRPLGLCASTVVLEPVVVAKDPYL